MTQNRAKATDRLSAQVRGDVPWLSPQARHQGTLELLMAAFTQNTTTTNATAVIVPINCIVVAAYACFRTKPVMASGTATIQAIAIAQDGSTVVNITNATSALLQTADVPFALALATTNPTLLPAGSSVKINQVTSNNTVGTAQAGGFVVLVVEPVEDNPIVD